MQTFHPGLIQANRIQEGHREHAERWRQAERARAHQVRSTRMSLRGPLTALARPKIGPGRRRTRRGTPRQALDGGPYSTRTEKAAERA